MKTTMILRCNLLDGRLWLLVTQRGTGSVKACRDSTIGCLTQAMDEHAAFASGGISGPNLTAPFGVVEAISLLMYAETTLRHLTHAVLFCCVCMAPLEL